MLEIVIASLLIGCIFAPLGCVVLWKKYAYLGDGLAHTSMLAAVITSILGVHIIYSSLVIVIVFALGIFKFKNISGSNASISFISSIMVAMAVILSSIYPSNINITGLLFGDIISIGLDDIVFLICILLTIILFISVFYKDILLIVFSRDIAFARGIRVELIEFLFLMILSIAIVCTIKMVGVLLVTSIIIIPAISARLISSTPFSMIIKSVLIAASMNAIGMLCSFHFDFPFASVIVSVGGAIFLILYSFNSCLKPGRKK